MCTLCERKFRRMRDLVEHDALVHPKPGNCNCEICEQQFESRSCLYNHYSSAHISRELLDCDDNNPQQTDENVQIETINEQRQIKSAKNQEILADEEQMRKTILDFSLPIEEMDQPVNNEPASINKKTLIRGLIDRKYQCRWCELKFFQKKHLQQHEQTHHKNTTLSCPVCDKVFTRKDRLNGHMKCHMEPSLECKVIY